MGPTVPQPIDYIERMLEFHPEEPPYRWAQPGELPAPAGGPIRPEQARIVLVSLAGIRLRAQPAFDLRGDTSIRLVPLEAARGELAVDHFGFKLERVREDVEPVAPFAALQVLAAEGLIGGVEPEAVCVMGATYSQRRVVTELAPAVVESVQAARGGEETGRAPVALIVPACPLDHQTAALLARAIEATGIRTLVLSAARDVSRHVGAPRTVYLHAPLGWMLGMPGDEAGQRARLAAALRAGLAMPGTGEVAELDPEYPSGSTSTPASLAHPDLEDWEAREFRPGYDTGASR